jgi:hypothetical protein
MATTSASDWVVVPYGPEHRVEMERLVGGDYDPANGRYGADWAGMRMRSRGLVTPAGYGYNGVYLETFQLPDGRVLAKRDDKYAPYSKFRMFASRGEFNAWARETLKYDIDPETGRPFRR